LQKRPGLPGPVIGSDVDASEKQQGWGKNPKKNLEFTSWVDLVDQSNRM